MKKIFLLSALVLILSSAAFAASESDNLKSAYYKVKFSIFESMPRDENKIVFLGDSLTDYMKFDELVPDLTIKNRGIAGDTTSGVLKRLDEVISLKPSKLFILIGTNDIVFDIKADKIVSNIKKIIDTFREKSPQTALYVQTLFPVNHKFGDSRRPHETIRKINAGLVKLSNEINFTLIDTYSLFAEGGELPERYTVDGVHLNGAGAVKWVEFLSTWLHKK